MGVFPGWSANRNADRLVRIPEYHQTGQEKTGLTFLPDRISRIERFSKVIQ